MASTSQPRVRESWDRARFPLWTRNSKIVTRDGGPLLAASMICADPLSMGGQLDLLVQGGIDLIHFDVMDGMFVPRLGLYPELLAAVRDKTDLPIDVHLMVSKPDPWILAFSDAGADLIVVHAEATCGLPRALDLIRKSGPRPGVALNPATPLAGLKYVLEDIDAILLMMCNPGTIGEKARPSAIRKIEETHLYLGEHASRVHVIVDGNVSPQNAPRMARAGATILVCGTSSIFGGESDPAVSVRRFRGRLLESMLASASDGPAAGGDC